MWGNFLGNNAASDIKKGKILYKIFYRWKTVLNIFLDPEPKPEPGP